MMNVMNAGAGTGGIIITGIRKRIVYMTDGGG